MPVDLILQAGQGSSLKTYSTGVPFGRQLFVVYTSFFLLRRYIWNIFLYLFVPLRPFFKIFDQ